MILWTDLQPTVHRTTSNIHTHTTHAIYYPSLALIRAHLDSLLEYCEKGEGEGARLVYGGKRLDRPGLLCVCVCVVCVCVCVVCVMCTYMYIHYIHVLYCTLCQDSLWSPPSSLKWRTTCLLLRKSRSDLS